jgi:hypothetical protein
MFVRGFYPPFAKKNWKIGGNHKNQAVNLRTKVMNVDQRFYKIIVALTFSLKMLMLQAQQDTPRLLSIAVPGPVSANGQKPWYNIGSGHFNKLALVADTSSAFSPRQLAWPPLPGRFVLPVSSIGNDFYTQHFGFFCRQELHLEKTSGLPLRFRLGSLKDCNYLEGK